MACVIEAVDQLMADDPADVELLACCLDPAVGRQALAHAARVG